MKIHLGEIPEEGLRLQIVDESWFPDSEIERCGQVTAAVTLTKKAQRVLLEGSFATSIRLDCDRCLESFCRPLASRFELDLELVDRQPVSAGEEEHVCSSEEMDMLYLEEPVIDLFQILAQQVFLALPIKKLCAEECRGLCSRCGANLNRSACDCAAGEKHSPFSILSSLKR